jgi:hypothetical protein
MGLYLEPAIDKSQWLRENGKAITPVIFGKSDINWEDIPEDKVLVCLVDNGPFQAAGVAYNKREMEAFNLEGDPRSKIWYYVDREKARAIAPQWEFYIKENS